MHAALDVKLLLPCLCRHISNGKGGKIEGIHFSSRLAVAGRLMPVMKGERTTYRCQRRQAEIGLGWHSGSSQVPNPEDGGG